MKKIPITARGAKLLQEELEHLKKNERPAVIRAIAEARAHGDLKENAEYQAAREKQSFIEGRIKEIEYKLAHAQIIAVSQLPVSDRVVFGVTVSLINTQTNESATYQIVGEDEADVKAGRISVTSPVARALIGKAVGDTVQVHTPSGLLEYEIEQVLYVE